MVSKFICIYCLRRSPEVAPCEAHVFPYVMGGSVATDETVCRSCNGRRINRQVETPAYEPFRPLQGIFGVRGRRGRIRRVPGTVKIDGRKQKVSLNERGEIIGVVVFPRTDAEGRKDFSVHGPSDLLEPKIRALTERYPYLKWKEMPPIVEGKVVVEFGRNLSGSHVRRLAAKVAFERFAQIRSASFVSGAEYDPARKFILKGIEDEPICGVLFDRRILDGPFKAIPVGYHAVYINSHPLDRVLGAFVSFYGLFYYWVILSRRYTALGQTDDLLLENSQARKSTNPLMRTRTGTVRVPWGDIVRQYLRDPVSSEKEALEYAIKKLRAAADAFGREERRN